MLRIPIAQVPDVRQACVRGLSGRDERIVEDTDSRTAIRLIDRLLEPQCATDLPVGKADQLSPGERAAVLAAVYTEAFGPSVQATINCQKCATPVSLSFGVDSLLTSLGATARPAASLREVAGQFVLPDGCVFRVPRGEDELAVQGLTIDLAARELLARCLISGDQEGDGNSIEQALEVLAPTGDFDLLAQCTECGYANSIAFNVQYYVLESMRQERALLYGEIHQLAKIYRWGLDEILGLPRAERRTYAALLGAGSWQQGRAKT